MNKKKMILSSGFSYKELLIMKRNFQNIRKKYYDADDPIPEDEGLKEYILIISQIVFKDTTRMLFISALFSLLTCIFNNILGGVVMFFLSLIIVIFIIIKCGKIFNLRMIAIIKLIILHYRIKINLLRENH